MPSSFQFSPYDNSRASASLAELYLRQGEIAAEHVRQDAALRARQVREAGQGRAQVIGSLGHLASGGIEEYQQYKAQAPQRQMQALQLQHVQQQIADEQAQAGFRTAEAGRITKQTEDATKKQARETAEDQQLADLFQSGTPTPQDAFRIAGMRGLQQLKAYREGSLPDKGVILPRGGTLVDPNTGDVRATGAPEPAPKLTYGAPQVQLIGGQRALVRPGSDGQIYGMDLQPIAADQIAPEPKAAAGPTGNAQVEQGNAHEVAKGIQDGTSSPEILLTTRATAQGMALGAELHKMGVDTNKLTREWTATKGAIRSLNGAQQIRLTEVINKASASLDQLDTLNKQWSQNATRWGIKVLNHASLKAAQNGLYGPEAASVAQRLESQIADVTSELGQGIMGGNSPTDHALSLAAKNLSADWTQKVLSDSIGQVRYNLNLAQNARNEILQGLGVSSTQVQTPAPATVKDPLGIR